MTCSVCAAGFRESAGGAMWKNSAAHEDVAPAEALYLEVGAGLCRHRPRHAVVPRASAGGAGRIREGQGDTLCLFYASLLIIFLFVLLYISNKFAQGKQFSFLPLSSSFN